MRSSFGPSDFCHALRRLAVETGAADPAVSPASVAVTERNLTSTQKGGGGMVGSLVALAGYGKGEAEGGGGGAGGDGGSVRIARELSPAQVELAVAMVQVSWGKVW